MNNVRSLVNGCRETNRRLAGALAVLALVVVSVGVEAPVRAQSPTPFGAASAEEVQLLPSIYETNAVDLVLDSDGFPIVVGTGENDTSASLDRQLRVARCLDATCTPGEVAAPAFNVGPPFDDDPLVVPFAPQIALPPGSDFPIVAFNDFADDSIKLYRCEDEACQGPNGPELLLSVEAPGFSNRSRSALSLEVTEAGLPVVGWAQSGVVGDPTPTEYVTITCLDVDCETWHREVYEPDGVGPGFQITSSQLVLGTDGSVTVVLADEEWVWVVQRACLDGGCGESQSRSFDIGGRVADLDADVDSVGNVSVAVILYPPGLRPTIAVLRCLDAGCDDADLTTPLGTRSDEDDILDGVRLAIRDDDRPVVSYWSLLTTSALKVFACDTPECASGSATARNAVFGAGRPGFDMVLDPSGNPVFATSFGSDALVAVCDTPGCGVTPACAGFAVTVDLAAGEAPTPGNDVVLGTDDADVIAAGDGADVVCGLGGDDRIWGQAGADQVFGGDGADVIRGGDGDDYLVGGWEEDDISGGRGDDLIFGGPGADVALRGGTGADFVRGDAGDDVLLNGNGGLDIVAAGPGSHALIAGGPRADILVGGEGDDVLKGNGGADDISGGGGDDELRGGPQADLLYGGAGNDTCNGGTTGDGAPENDAADANCEVIALVP